MKPEGKNCANCADKETKGDDKPCVECAMASMGKICYWTPTQRKKTCESCRHLMKDPEGRHVIGSTICIDCEVRCLENNWEPKKSSFEDWWEKHRYDVKNGAYSWRRIEAKDTWNAAQENRSPKEPKKLDFEEWWERNKKSVKARMVKGEKFDCIKFKTHMIWKHAQENKL